MQNNINRGDNMLYPWAQINIKTLTKKRQRKFNKMVKDANKNVSVDSLWRGRFVVKQLQRTVTKYEDGSGASIRYKIGLYDKKTKQYAYAFIVDRGGRLFTGYILFRALNKFITETLDVWRNEKPKEDMTDYNKIEFVQSDYNLMHDYAIFY